MIARCLSLFVAILLFTSPTFSQESAVGRIEFGQPLEALYKLQFDQNDVFLHFPPRKVSIGAKDRRGSSLEYEGEGSIGSVRVSDALFAALIPFIAVGPRTTILGLTVSAPGLANAATAVNSFSAQMAAAELMITSGTNVAVAMDGGEIVDAGTAAVLAVDPTGFEGAVFFQAMEGGVEGAFFDAEDVAGDFDDGGHDGVAVKRGAAGEDLEDEEVEGSLEGVLFGHGGYLAGLVLRQLSTGLG